MVKRRLSLLTLILLLAATTRLLGIQVQSIWFDEGWSAYAAAQPTLYAAWQADQTNPPLYYLLLNIAARGFGTSELALRYVSLLLGILMIPLVYQLARRSAGERAGRIAALLAAFSAPLWWAAQEARMYTLLALLIVVCVLAWQQIARKPTRVAWLALWLGELALLYSHNTGPVAFIALSAVQLLTWLVWHPRQRMFLLWLVGQLAVGVLWLPYFFNRFLLLGAANSAVTSAPEIGLPLLWQVWQGLWVAPWALALRSLPALTVLSAVILLVALVLFRRRALWLIAHVLILTVVMLAGLILLGNDLHGRYLVMIVPLLLAAVAIGIARLRAASLRYAALIPFLLLFAFDLIEAQNPDYQHDEVRAMVQYYADHLTADDSVVAWSYADRYELAYYWDRLGVQAKRVTLPEGADLDAVLPLLPTSGDVALNVWYTQRADYRGMMGCVLGSGTTDEPERYTTYGMATLIYHDPALALPGLQPVDFTFTDGGANPIARVDGVGRVPPATTDRALCLPLRLTLVRDVNTDLKAALLVQNELGWTVVSADAVFATANQRTSADVEPGESLAAYPLLRLPYGAPPGNYRIFLRLYDENAMPSGYNPPQAGQTVLGRDLLLATWTALPGATWTMTTRTTDLPNLVNLAVSGDLTLLADNLPQEETTIANGDEIRVALLWRGAGERPDLELAAEDGAWRVSAPAHLNNHGEIALDWRSLRVPPDAPSGAALLRLGGWAVLAHYRVEALPLLSEPPAFDRAVNTVFADVGDLVGYTLSAPPFSRANPPQVTLIWRAGERSPAISYIVTAQLVNTAGQVVAQSDAVPGGRPTTGWRAGEYIVDPHTLVFNDSAAPGTTTLLVALYDPQTGARVRLADSSDAVQLESGIELNP